ncbi:hypothetical protein H8356DRAFT_1430373 [Neocallimastix lanati (nom. inval.)]|nr:hypothetical protein H8356DRAFT_1430373 [Neocallimastix sp. JGI-2020a]
MIFLNNCDKYGVSIGNKNVGVVFFDDNIVLIVSIKKCATMVIKPLNFVSYLGYEEPTISFWLLENPYFLSLVFHPIIDSFKNAFSEMGKKKRFLSSHNKENSPALLIFIKNFPDWTVYQSFTSSITASSCIFIFYFFIFTNNISDHLSCLLTSEI